MSDQRDESEVDSEDVSLRGFVVQTVLFTIVLFIGVVILAQWLKEPTQIFANWVVDELGLVGMFAGMVAADAFTFPVPPDTYLLVAVASETDVLPVLVTVCFGSVLAGSMAYVFGPLLRSVPFLHGRIEAFRPKGEALFKRYGVWTVTVAALTPLPFSVVCWFAGIYHMPYKTFFLATLMRIPRFIGYYYLFVLGWSP